jgi:hypothetical protein
MIPSIASICGGSQFRDNTNPAEAVDEFSKVFHEVIPPYLSAYRLLLTQPK